MSTTHNSRLCPQSPVQTHLYLQAICETDTWIAWAGLGLPGNSTDSFLPPLQLSIAGNVATAVLPGLQKNTDYKISIWAYYKDGARSDTVSVQHRTSKWSVFGTHRLGVIRLGAQNALEHITERQLRSGHLQLCKPKHECLKVARHI